MEPIWLTLDAVRAIHAETITAFGGAAGERNPDGLESALDKARNRWAYAPNVTIAELAAAYCAGIVQNHPFVDGNKRTGILAAVSFLDLNGFDLHPEEADLAATVLEFAAGTIDETEFTAWIEANLRPRDSDD